MCLGVYCYECLSDDTLSHVYLNIPKILNECSFDTYYIKQTFSNYQITTSLKCFHQTLRILNIYLRGIGICLKCSRVIIGGEVSQGVVTGLKYHVIITSSHCFPGQPYEKRVFAQNVTWSYQNTRQYLKLNSYNIFRNQKVCHIHGSSPSIQRSNCKGNVYFLLLFFFWNWGTIRKSEPHITKVVSLVLI